MRQETLCLNGTKIINSYVAAVVAASGQAAQGQSDCDVTSGIRGCAAASRPAATADGLGEHTAHHGIVLAHAGYPNEHRQQQGE